MTSFVIRNADDMARLNSFINSQKTTLTVDIRQGEKRSSDQNRKLWPMLNDVSQQCELIINGRPTKATADDWKQIFTANLHKQNRMALGVDGEIVYLGGSTSRMTKSEFADLIELIYAYGSEKQVIWSEPALRAYAEYQEAV